MSFVGRLLCIVCLLGAVSCRPFGGLFHRSSTQPHLVKAEELLHQRDFDGAIAEYRAHIEERLALHSRPEWENPYFYLLLIGDIEIQQGKWDQALSTYHQAEQAGVEGLLISDRYRFVAHRFEGEGNLKRAIEVLTEYRYSDPEFFDTILDRLAKKLTSQEEAKTPHPIALK